MPNKYYIGLDQGTTGVTTLLLDEKWNAVSRGYKEIHQFYPNAGWVEHDPLNILYSQLNSITTVLRSGKFSAKDIAGIGITSGILDEQLFGVVIMMTLITTVFAPPALNAVIKSPKKGTNKDVKAEATVSSIWEFKTEEIADLVAYLYLKDLRKEGFFVFTVNSDEGISQARINKTVITRNQKH